MDEGSSFSLRFEFDRGGAIYRSGIRFNKVRAIRWRAERPRTVWHIDGVYDTIAEVEDSPWVEELCRAESAQLWGYWIIRHFMVYFDGSGCLEAAAEWWELLPDELVE